MARDPKYDVLFEPVDIGPKVMKNRFYQTPHCSNLGSEQPGAQAHMREMKAEGGWAVVNTEYCSVHPESDDSPFIPARLWDDNDVRNLALMCDRVHDHGALAGIELHYGGIHASGYTSRTVGRAATQSPSESFWMTSCVEMDVREIRELESFYVGAARRALSAGFDIINVHGADLSTAPAQFLVQRYNRRTDQYGGSLENRARLWLEILEEVRNTVDGRAAVTARLCIDSTDPSGEGMDVDEEGVGFIALADELVDFWDLQVGGPSLADWVSDDSVPSRFFGENARAAIIKHARAQTSKPVVAVGRVTSPDTMVAIIQSGQQDIIGAARPSIADPFLPKKVELGRLDEIRECIGCNMCVARTAQSSNIVCTQNATMGEEYRRGWHPERFDIAEDADSTDVLVVGAGPAGLECAIVLGKRGIRRVHLVDSAAEMGGAMRWITELPGLGAWSRVCGWRATQISKLKNVTFIPSTTLSADAALDYGAEVVVIATGSTWSTDGLNGVTRKAVPGADADLPHVLTPEQVMAEGKYPVGKHLLIYDVDGYFMGVSLAERFAREGLTVTLVSALPGIAPYMAFTGELKYMLKRLVKLKVTLVPGHILTDVRAGVVKGQALIFDTPAEWEADATLLVTQRVSRDALYRKLLARSDEWAGAGIRGVYRVGDCAAPRLLADAIFDGHRMGRELDGPNPAQPLPFIRENRVLGLSDREYDSRVLGGSSRAYTPKSCRSHAEAAAVTGR